MCKIIEREMSDTTRSATKTPLPSPPPQIRLREYRPSDCSTVFKLVSDGWLDQFNKKSTPHLYQYVNAWVEDTLRPSFDNVSTSLHYSYGGKLWVAENANCVIVGSVGVRVMTNTKQVTELVRLAVDPEWRGRGIGKYLLHHAISYATQIIGVHTIWLETMECMRAACELYERNGFKRFGKLTPRGNTVLGYGVDFSYDVFYRLVL